ncbi:hypothetical protein [Sphingomonas hylomeconis]|uniref:Tail terminator n=1 Tax=Sphingomonas hylomeconis TaxID=1395958 RepID=A0ABV7SS99_9SPHN|nr:hypothetical protein [Sphingomonas hylomeconis]
MSKRVDVLNAVKEMVQLALPGASVKGMTADEAKPEAVGLLGMVIVRSGDPGSPDIDLCPPTYHYEHSIPIEIAAYQSSSRTSQEVLDDMMSLIGARIAADRFLGGLCNYLDAEAPTDGETDMRGAVPVGWAEFSIIASYSTNSPLG